MINFQIGTVVQTKSIFNACIENLEAQKELLECLEKYQSCDWGNTCKDDQKLNDHAVKNNDDRIVAKYHLKTLNRDIFIITEIDRSVTSILFCEEY